MRALSHDEENADVYPLWSTQRRSSDKPNVLFLFKLSGSALVRHQKHRRLESTENVFEDDASLVAATGSYSDKTAEATATEEEE